MERKKGRPRKPFEGDTSLGKLSRNEIMRRYRLRMNMDGKGQVVYWIDSNLIERIKIFAQENGKNTSDLVNDVLLIFFGR